MGDAAAHVWPKSLEAGRVPTIITTLFQCADDSSHDASIQFSKCFAENGELVARGHVCKGRDEIVKFREGAWDPISRREHKVLKAYVSEHDENDVFVLGTVMFGHKNGQSVTQHFTGNFIFERKGQETLIRNYQAWLDSKPLADLLANARE